MATLYRGNFGVPPLDIPPLDLPDVKKVLDVGDKIQMPPEGDPAAKNYMVPLAVALAAFLLIK